jgi:hypothetical protein
MKNLLYLLLLMSCAASADFFFVNTVADFRQALIDASNNSEHDTINVAPGHYDISGGTLLYGPGSGGDFGDDDSGLTIQGEDANSTILDGKNLVTPLTIQFISIEPVGPIEISGLAFKNGKGENGGGLSIKQDINSQGENVTIKNSHFIQNTAEQNGGGAYLSLSWSSSAILMDNRFIENKAGGDGGGFYIPSLSGSLEAADNEFIINQAGKSGGGAFSNEGVNNLTDNRFVKNKAGGSGGGLFCGGTWVCSVTGNEFTLNAAKNSGGGATAVSTSVTVTANRFYNNRAGSSGGGLIASDDDGGLIIGNNHFIENRAVLDGGGARVYGDHVASFYNNVLGSNKAGHQGGGIYTIASGTVSLINNTLTNNESGAEGGGIYIGDTGSTIFNNIIWGNHASAGGNDGNDLFASTGEYDNVSLLNNNLGPNTDFETANSPDLVIIDTTNYSHTDNIISDPLLTNDFHLQYGSLAIDAGDNKAVQSPPLWPGHPKINTDFEGDPRIINGNSGGKPIVDIGADENARADVNRDGCVDRTDADIILHNIRADSEDPEDDINEDSTVNRADARVVVRLFTGGPPCKKVLLEYAKSAGGVGYDIGNGIAIDATGNSVVTGSFSSRAIFGADESNETVLLSSAGSSDIYIAKYTPGGSLIWVTQAGGEITDFGSGLALDIAGNSVVTGAFWGKATFGADELNQTVLTSAGNHDIFVAKYAPDGSLVWATQAGGENSDLGSGLALDTAGNSVVTGTFSGKATFGAGESNESVLTSAGGNELFIAKYAADGSLIWAKQTGGTGGVRNFGIVVDATGNIVVTGSFWGKATFGAGELNQTVLTSLGGEDIFVAKYKLNGSLIWVAQAGGANSEGGNGIAVDVAGNSVVAGYFLGNATFGPGEPNETVLKDRGIFVAKYASNGSLIWAIQAYSGSGGINVNPRGNFIAIDSIGNILLTGSFSDSATFGTGETNKTVLTSAGSRDIFAAKYTPDGSHDWAIRAGGVNYDAGYGIAVDTAGNSIVTGSFADKATFGAGEPNKTVLTSAGRGDIFVAKFKSIQFSSTN